jgi:hypothetical protein
LLIVNRIFGGTSGKYFVYLGYKLLFMAMMKSMKRMGPTNQMSDTTGVPSWAGKINKRTIAEIKSPELGDKRREMEAMKLKESMKKYKKAYAADQAEMGNIVKFQKDKK